ncbi:hypothetical protein IT570_13005 [Candidatus Sumerlaeota bacterium]|nr:hypothetical protein [Candidatus Sumerlaeota bacterium]
MSAIAPVKSEIKSEAPAFWLVVSALLYAALTWPVLFCGITGPGGPAHDETNYHLPVVHQFLGQWPHPDLSDYPSALAPGYYLLLVGLAKALGGDTHLFRFVTGLFVIGSVLFLQVFLPRKISAVRAFVIALPLMVLPIALRSGMWFLTDFPAFFFIVLGLGAAIMAPGNRKWSVVAILCIAISLSFRQLSLWIVPPIAYALWQRNRQTPLGTVEALACVLSAMLPLWWMMSLWGGMTTPTFQVRYQKPNPASITMALAYVGCITPFFIAANPAMLKGILSRKVGVTTSLVIGLIPALAWPTSYSLNEGRSGGPLWEIARHLPTVGERSLFFLPLCIAGVLGLFIMRRGARLCGDLVRANALIFALLSMMLLHGTIHEAYERYYQPAIMLICGWLFALTIPDRRSESRVTMMPILLLAFGFFVLSLISEYYTLFRVHPLD